VTSAIDLDARNRDFAWPDHEGPGGFLTAEQMQAYDRDGFVVLEQALDRERLATVQAELDGFNAQQEARLRAKGGTQGISRVDELVFTSHLAERNDVLRDFVTSEPFTGVLADLLGPEVLFDWDQTVYKQPETPKDFPWHQDTGYAFAEPQWGSLTCWIPLVDVTLENGCMWVVPGAHRHGTLPHWETPIGLVCKDDDEGAITVEMKAGDLLVFAGLTPHKSGPNLSQGVRKAYIAQYAVGNSRTWYNNGPEEGMRLADDPEHHFPVVVNGPATG
jgi:phytanoyl-CoA hydroxylase